MASKPLKQDLRCAGIWLCFGLALDLLWFQFGVNLDLFTCIFCSARVMSIWFWRAFGLVLESDLVLAQRATGCKTGCSAQIKNLSQSFTIRIWKVRVCMLLLERWSPVVTCIAISSRS